MTATSVTPVTLLTAFLGSGKTTLLNRRMLYDDIQRKTAKKEKERTRYIDEVKRVLMKKLYENRIEGEVTGRIKQIYSIYLKMKDQNINFDQVYDITAFRVIVNTVKECYDVLGMIHSLWKPIPGKFKDYIGLPKENMYQSLHTSAIGHYGERIEIQIRTHEMHKIAEEGIAAHWKYKEGRIIEEADDKRFTWLRQLLEWQRDLKDTAQIDDALDACGRRGITKVRRGLTVDARELGACRHRMDEVIGNVYPFKRTIETCRVGCVGGDDLDTLPLMCLECLAAARGSAD